MPLMPGTCLGPYEIAAPLGAGGMGEVYRARDTKLNRDVALKILPSEFALDPDRLARFKREAQVLASLNHPNIAAIYGFEDADATHALVLEAAAAAGSWWFRIRLTAIPFAPGHRSSGRRKQSRVGPVSAGSICTRMGSGSW
jgi:hypothetical protein